MARTLSAILLAVLFVGTGLLTYQIYYWVAKSVPDEYQLLAQLLAGLPFGIACSLRFVHPRRWIAVTVLLDCVTWVVAYRLGLVYAGNVFLSFIFAGLVGAVGVTLSTGLGCRSLYRLRTLAGVALIGAVTGAPFGLIPNHTDWQNLVLAISFPLWQVAVGLWIWRSSGRSTD